LTIKGIEVLTKQAFKPVDESQPSLDNWVTSTEIEHLISKLIHKTHFFYNNLHQVRSKPKYMKAK
jgi:hypothetical protein